ncbi:zinc-finger domain-containing protein [Permianibacter sp. IMCC34836]|uniref:zinc-finger domain-containing protein n=1 Tax=Permianibacter fluminis TaxID=2738515 RepID=UPI001552659B|nr:zinc-finger domain-containing protein [Permianibacter fluminis]NQD35434.1 zinc-finger domain-containing protein [Permianibacter fluminis]
MSHSSSASSNPAVKTYEVTKSDLPLSCPGKFMTLWNMHPKVYLPIERTGHAACPYCGAQYKLVG